jgi:hypothetical protein
MHERSARQADEQEAAFRNYVKQTASNGATGTADELAKLADLKARGVITEEEFQREKAKALS